MKNSKRSKARTGLAGAMAMAALGLVSAGPALAQADQSTSQTQVAQAPPSSDAMGSFFGDWFARVDATQAAQPHWMTPMATTTPRLEEEFRYDQSFETLGHSGGHLDNFGGGKGLELIPFYPIEVIFGVPPYIEKSTPKTTVSGWNDWPFLLVKYRILSANEQSGNYILTAFLQGSAPTGILALTSHSYMITPTIAAGWGIGDFDVQTTLGESFPTEHTDVGKVISWNTAFQYHLWEILWPEVEFNWMHFSTGERGGLSQGFITPGIVFGRFHIVDRIKLSIGLGYQIAVEPSPTVPKPLTPMYKNNFILSTRFSF
jgi:hypothetical protein